jgi:hypothetical protein
MYCFFFILTNIYLKNKRMAKQQNKGSNSVKVTFGKKKSGKGRIKKKYGPKAEKPKKYRGQGR